ncbi:MAG: DUF2628 domain-containing protein [Alphaproteobacteria bacterium]|nr:DUF2628 domain-containing protein [Alphaproteobacteria bacterium]
MRLYTVHQPLDGDPEDLVLVRDGFSFWAFLFTVLWALWNRLWWEAAALIVIWVVLSLIMNLLGADDFTQLMVSLGFQILVGFEARDLQRWALARRGWQELGMVSGNSEEAAERRFLDLMAVN